MAAARAAGFDNVSIDLIYGVHGQTVDDARRGLQERFSIDEEQANYVLALQLRRLTKLDVIELQAEALDEAAARNLADAVRGLVALASLQAAQKPELQKLVSGIQVASQGTRATLRLAVPWALLDELDKKPAAPPAGTVTEAPRR